MASWIAINKIHWSHRYLQNPLIFAMTKGSAVENYGKHLPTSAGRSAMLFSKLTAWLAWCHRQVGAQWLVSHLKCFQMALWKMSFSFGDNMINPWVWLDHVDPTDVTLWSIPPALSDDSATGSFQWCNLTCCPGVEFGFLESSFMENLDMTCLIDNFPTNKNGEIPVFHATVYQMVSLIEWVSLVI